MPRSNIHKTRGVVLQQIKYSESSIIAKIYTEAFGIQSFMVRGVRKKGSKMKSSLFQALSLVDMVVYYKEKSNIQHLKEIKSAFPFTTIPFEIKKSSIVLFINEILYKTLREEEANPGLFNFIFNSVCFLDLEKGNITDFHVLFIIQLCRHLGFFPKENYSEKNNIFDLSEGIFLDKAPGHIHFMENPLSRYLSRFLKISFEDLDQNKIPSAIRKDLLEKLLEYYKLQQQDFGDLKSYPILQTILKPS